MKSERVTIQLRAVEDFSLHFVLYKLYKVALTLESPVEMPCIIVKDG